AVEVADGEADDAAAGIEIDARPQQSSANPEKHGHDAAVPAAHDDVQQAVAVHIGQHHAGREGPGREVTDQGQGAGAVAAQNAHRPRDATSDDHVQPSVAVEIAD